MRVNLIIIMGLLLFHVTFGQNQEKYTEYKNEAWKLYESKDYKKSAEKYMAAFNQLDGKAHAIDRYNAACSYALAKDSKLAFYHLFKLAIDSKYNNYEHISGDKDLNILYTDKRWKEFLDIVKSNKEGIDRDLDEPLIAILDSIYLEDQFYRRQIIEVEKKHGRYSEEMKAHWKTIEKKDSLNLFKVEKILDERGWLGTDVIGEQGNSTLFLVIQHSKLETQVKYLPMMSEAVKSGNAKASRLALLKDRIALRQGNRQIYGSQIGRDKETGEYFVLPLIKPENVDQRRADVGLGSLSDYIYNWDMSWDIEKHKERTKRLEAKKNR